MFLSSVAYGQIQNYRQLVNELQFNRDLSAHWGLELDVGHSYTSTPETKHLLSSLAQLYGNVAVHYAPSNRWKLSYVYAYYFNKYVPEIDQRAAPEWRSTVQAVYYIQRKRQILSTQLQIEDRHILNTDSVFEAVERLRTQLKIVYPFNGKSIKKHVLYGIASEELIFKTNSKISGNGLFDRNKFIAGIGYSFTDNMQLEATYINEFLPRDISNNYNELQITAIFNNLLPRLTKYISGRKNK